MMMLRHFSRTVCAAAVLVTLSVVFGVSSAQPGPGRGGFGIDSRADSRTYMFEDAGEEMPYCMYVSSKVTPDEPAPLIIALHGMGAPPDIMCNATTIDLAEEGGYILAAPMGYNTTGWYGFPFGAGPGRGAAPANGPGRGAAPAGRGRAGGGRGAGGPFGGGNAPENLAELSEDDVMNVLAIMRDEFNIDEDRIYVTGHSMGGAGTFFMAAEHSDIWAAAAPVAPAAFTSEEEREAMVQKIAAANLPVMVVHGDADAVVPVSTSRDQWVPSMRTAGVDVEYVEQPGIDHGPVITTSQAEIFRFFGEHSK
jgi:poly(3-hydroxybutyrate) depolymerase